MSVSETWKVMADGGAEVGEVAVGRVRFLGEVHAPDRVGVVQARVGEREEGVEHRPGRQHTPPPQRAAPAHCGTWAWSCLALAFLSGRNGTQSGWSSAGGEGQRTQAARPIERRVAVRKSLGLTPMSPQASRDRRCVAGARACRGSRTKGARVPLKSTATSTSSCAARRDPQRSSVLV